MDELLYKLEECGLGYKLYNVYCGILMCADDILAYYCVALQLNFS